MQIIYKKLEELHPYKNNPRRNDQAVDAVANSIQEFGFKVPAVIDKNGEIIAGHTRYKAAKKLKIKEIPCIIADDLTEEQIRAFRLADNKVSEASEWDFNILGEEIGVITEIDMQKFGFEEVTMDDFGTDFSLPNGEKGDIVNMTLTLDRRQREFIDECLRAVDVTHDCYNNTNSTGNKIYEVFRQWDERKMFS